MSSWALYIAIAILLVTVGFFVYRREPKLSAYQFFWCLSALLAAWLLINYGSITATEPDTFLLFVRLVMVVTNLMMIIVYLFSLTFPKRPLRLAVRYRIILFVWAFFLTLLNLSPFVFPTCHLEGDALNPDPSWGMLFDVANMLGFLYFSSVHFYRLSRKSQGLEKIRLTYLTASLTVSLSIAFITNVILPLVFHNSDFMNFGIGAMSLVIIGATGYTMLKSSFASLDFVIAKICYYISLAVMLLLPIGYAHLLQQMWWLDIIFFGAWLVTFIFIYEHFDKFLVAKIVNHGADWQTEYDKFLDNVSQELDYHQIIDGTLSFLDTLIKNHGNLFIADFLSDNSLHSIGELKVNETTRSVIGQIEKLWDAGQCEPLILEELIDRRQVKYRSLVKYMKTNHLAAIFPLAYYREFKGVLLMSAKRNGNPFFIQDINLVRKTINEIAPLLNQAAIHQSTLEFNKYLKRRVDAATRKLQKVNAQLVVADKLKDDFVSVASHELRTPMTAIKGYLWLVAHNNQPAKIAENQKYIEIALNSTQRLINLVNDMLTISRIEGGKMTLHPQRLDARTLLHEAHADLLPIATDKKLDFAVKAPARPLWIAADKDKAQEVLHNLVGNALKFTTAGGVTLRARSDADYVYLDVTDTGCGIDQEDFQKLFQKFARMEKSYVKIKETGTGLGLYISRQIMTLHHGGITFKSKLGKGSTFTIYFPKCKKL
ncbi:hypothetical protein IJJ12_00470 [bacterium]|nr:hypothetical protein [bacterium]